MALLPGWDAEPSIPRGVVDDENSDLPQEPAGYFAKLRSHRHSGGGGAGDSHAPVLSRASAPLQHVPRSATMSAAAAAAAIGVKGMPQPPHAAVTRTTSMPYGSPGSHAAANAGGLLQPHKYQFTDWANELSSLGGGKHPPPASNGGPHVEVHHSGDKHHGAAWWRALEAGQLNELPESETAVGARGKHGGGGGGGPVEEHGRVGAHASSFVPQFTPKQQLDFGSVGGGGGGAGGASGGDTNADAGDGI